MLTTDEELRQIEDGLRDQDGDFTGRLALLQGVLRWAAPGRQGYLLAVAAVATALLRVVAATRRLLIEAGYYSMLALEPLALAFCDMACAGWDSGLEPGNRSLGITGREARPGR